MLVTMSNKELHRLPVIQAVVDYVGFGPTLAAEKLQERHGISVSVETLRCWMTADGLWVPHAHRRPRVQVAKFIMPLHLQKSYSTN